MSWKLKLICFLFTAPLRTAPRLGNMLGGTPIVLAGPCFTPGEVITCTFDEDTHVMGMYISEVLAVCVSPYFETRGWKDLTLNISTEVREVRYTGQGRFYAGERAIGLGLLVRARARARGTGEG